MGFSNKTPLSDGRWLLYCQVLILLKKETLMIAAGIIGRSGGIHCIHRKSVCGQKNKILGRRFQKLARREKRAAFQRTLAALVVTGCVLWRAGGQWEADET